MTPVKKTVRRVSVRSKTPKAPPQQEVASVPPVVFALFGAALGYFLSKSGMTDYNRILNMFLFKDRTLYLVIAVAILVVMAAFFIFEKRKVQSLTGEDIVCKRSPIQKERLVGAALFGVGWALAGACPAVALAQVGEGKWIALATLVGILVGVWSYGLWMDSEPKK